MITLREATEAEFYAEAKRRGYRLTELDDFQYEAHQDHNAGMHDDYVTDCPDCEAEERDQVAAHVAKAIVKALG